MRTYVVIEFLEWSSVVDVKIVTNDSLKVKNASNEIDKTELYLEAWEDEEKLYDIHFTGDFWYCGAGVKQIPEAYQEEAEEWVDWLTEKYDRDGFI